MHTYEQPLIRATVKENSDSANIFSLRCRDGSGNGSEGGDTGRNYKDSIRKLALYKRLLVGYRWSKTETYGRSWRVIIQ